MASAGYAPAASLKPPAPWGAPAHQRAASAGYAPAASLKPERWWGHVERVCVRCIRGVRPRGLIEAGPGRGASGGPWRGIRGVRPRGLIEAWSAQRLSAGFASRIRGVRPRGLIEATPCQRLPSSGWSIRGVRPRGLIEAVTVRGRRMEILCASAGYAPAASLKQQREEPRVEAPPQASAGYAPAASLKPLIGLPGGLALAHAHPRGTPPRPH